MVEARWVIMDSVSGLLRPTMLLTVVVEVQIGEDGADRGIRTPGLQRMSRSPNGWEPRMYCRGFPFERLRQRSWSRHCRVCRVEPDPVAVFSKACSRSQRSSLQAEGRSRQARRRSGRRGSS